LCKEEDLGEGKLLTKKGVKGTKAHQRKETMISSKLKNKRDTVEK